MGESNKTVVRSFAEAGNRGDLDAFDTLLAADFVRHCEATPEISIATCEQFKQFYRDTATTFPNQRMTLDTLVAEGDRVAFWGKFSGTQDGPMGPFPATGKRLESQIAGMFRIVRRHALPLRIRFGSHHQEAPHERLDSHDLPLVATRPRHPVGRSGHGHRYSGPGAGADHRLQDAPRADTPVR